MRNPPNKYLKLKEIGQGTYGVVYLGKREEDMEDEDFQKFAIKKIRMGNLDDGVSVAALREIKMLQELKHENIVALYDVYLQNHTNIHLVYEYLDTDLYRIIYDPNIMFSAADIKSYMKMLLTGIQHCHKNWTLHRDLKPGNLLIAADGTLKIGDFGLAKMYGSPDRRYSPQSITRWYRPPEMLYGAELYTTSADMWSVGCIFAELMLRNPIFPGDDDIDQLSKIFSALGTPTEEKWPGMKSLPNYIEFEDYPATPFKLIFTAASDDALDLLSKLLQFDPSKRLSAEDALKHPFFRNAPAPTPKDQLPKIKKTSPEVGDKRRERPPTSGDAPINNSTSNGNSNTERSSVRRKLELD